MRICVVTEMYQLGGPDTVLAELLDAWPDPADEFVIVTNRYSERFRPFFDTRVRRPVQWLTSPSLAPADLLRRVLAFPWRWPGRLALLLAQYPLFLWNAARLVKLFRRIRPDVLLINNGGYPGGDTCRAAVWAGALCGIHPVVMVVHSLPMVPRLWRWLPELLIDRYLDRHARVVCVSMAALSRLREVRAFHQPGVVIPNGFTPRVAPGLTRQDLLREFGLPPRSYLVAIVASYDHGKGHHLLFQAVATLKGRFPETRVLVFGEGNAAQLARLQGLVRQHNLDDVVTLCGFRQDVTAYLEATDLLVLPTLRIESLPMVIIEAMGLRVPVIASDVGGIRELIEDAVTGRLLPPGDISALTDAIAQAVDHPEVTREWTKQAHERYRATHTGEAMARSYHLLLTGKDQLLP